MPNAKQITTKARTWATKHIAAAAIIAFAAGIVIGLVLG